MTVVISTQKQAKVNAVRKAFELLFDEVNVESCKTESGVPEQPMGEELQRGAENRILEAKKKYEGKDIDFFVGVEAGIFEFAGTYFNTQLVCIEDKHGKKSTGLSQSFPIPKGLLEEACTTSVANVLDRVFNNKGGLRMLTHGVENRENSIQEGTLMALTGLINGKKW